MRRIAAIGVLACSLTCDRDVTPTTAQPPATTTTTATTTQTTAATTTTTTTATPTQTLVEARRGFTPKHVQQESAGPPPQPPNDAFSLVRYPAQVGELSAFLSKPPPGAGRHPAIVWITGGDCNSIDPVWEAQPRDNDQTATQYRDAGLVMMFPSLRGGSDNPGAREGFLGEVDDVIAAGEFLRKLDHVDPDRIYLGGHSTGGTLALLVAESTDRFRAVFSFGPVDQIDGYPLQEWPMISLTDNRGLELRSPVNWLHSIRVPVFVIEGVDGGNAFALDAIRRRSQNPLVHVLPIPGADHFDVLAPANEVIAKKLLADTGDVGKLAITQEEIVRRMSG